MSATFCPKQSSATTAVASGSSTSASLDPSCPQVRLMWSGATPPTVRWGKGAQTAVSTDMAITPNYAPEAFTKQDADTIAVLGTGTLYIVCGHGE